MPRPRKWRHVCCLPVHTMYGPLGQQQSDQTIIMRIDEYEVIRLIDYEKLDQEQSAVRMRVARSTVQSIYQVARQKIADALINGYTLKIEGGEYRLYDEKERMHGCGRHRGRRRGQNR